MRVTAKPIAITSFVFAVAIVSSCGGPTVAPPLQVIHTYDVTTVLDTFSYETGTPSPPDCPAAGGGNLYCTHYRAFSGATLTGTLTTVDTVPAAPGPGEHASTGSFGGQFCDSVDYLRLQGCLHVGPIAVTPFTGTLSLTADSAIATLEGPHAAGRCYQGVGLAGTRGGDSLTGRVLWFLCSYRSPPSHYGRFVARLRK